MTYDWEKIFKDKSDKELYDIWLGKTFLPDSVIEYAKRELECRNFDFNDIDRYKKKWELYSLAEDIESTENKIFKRKPIPYLQSLIIGTVVTLIFFIISRQNQINYNWTFILIFYLFVIITSSLKYFLDKFIAESESKNLKTLINKKTEILNDFDYNGLQAEKIKILNDIKEQSITRIKQYQKFSNLAFWIATIAVIIYMILSA